MHMTTQKQLEGLHNKLSDLVEEMTDLSRQPETLEKHMGIILVAADMAEAWILVCELEPSRYNKAIRDGVLASLLRGAARA